MSEVYRIEDLRIKNKEGEIWLIIDNKVYNLTNFKDEHPGGGQVLVDQTDKDPDGTHAFHDVGHSSDAIELMRDYLMGELHQDDRTAKKESGGCLLS